MKNNIKLNYMTNEIIVAKETSNSLKYIKENFQSVCENAWEFKD